MKKSILSLFALASLLFMSCNSIISDFQVYRFNKKSQLHGERKDKLIEKALTEVDTVYLYNLSFTDYYYVWYHKDNHIHKFRVSPYKTKEYKPIEAVNFTIEEENIGKYFDSEKTTDSPYFSFWLSDREMLEIYVKDKKT